MQRPLAPIVPVEYSLPDDTDNPTVFNIQPLTGVQYMKCMANAISAARGNPEGVAISIETAIRYGLVGWRNFGDAEFTSNMDENISRLTTAQFSAIGNEIIRLSKLQDQDKKKSP